MSIFDRRRRAIAGADFLFGIVTPDGYPASAPTLSVAWPGGTETYALAAVRQPDVISAPLSDDGLEITVTTGPTQPGHTMRGLLPAEVWIDGGADYQGPARVLELVSQTSLAAATTGTAVLRLAAPLTCGGALVSQLTSASGSIVVQAGAAASDSLSFTLAGRLFEFDDLGGAVPGYALPLIDREASPGVRCTDTVLAERIKEAINAAALGVTATRSSLTITLTSGHNVTVAAGGDDAASLTCTSLTGATPSWRVRYLEHSATIPAADVGDVVRGIVWTLPWSRMAGADLPALGCVERGLIDVVLVPWETGLTDEGLYALVPGWRSVVPQAQTSWASQREAALSDLEDLLQSRLKAGQFVDQLLAEQFRAVHALLTAARILQGWETLGYDAAQALERYREDAAKALDAAMSRLRWIDLNDNGVIEATEQGVQAAGISPRRQTPRRAVDQRDVDERPARGRYWDPR